MTNLVDASGRKVPTIGPLALDAYVGDRIRIYVHAGSGKYDHFYGILREGIKEDDPEFFVDTMRFNGGVMPADFRRALSHGDRIELFNSQSPIFGIKEYRFIDESD